MFIIKQNFKIINEDVKKIKNIQYHKNMLFLIKRSEQIERHINWSSNNISSFLNRGLYIF